MNARSHHLLCLGINHQTAGLDLRGKLAFSALQLENTLSRLGCRGDQDLNGIQEFVILSTCNRVELYAVRADACFESLEALLAETHGLSLALFSDSLYRLQDEAVAAHLMKVAAGLDSLVLGEPQILGQVTEAYTQAQKYGTTGKVLSRLFQAAIHAGKRARTETAIGQNPASIASAALHMVSGTILDLSQARVLVLGAGRMAELVVGGLRKQGCQDFIVLNRSLEPARDLAGRWGGQAASLDALSDYLSTCDLVIASTGAPHTVLAANRVAEAMASRPDRPMVLMDIAVPRDIDPGTADIQNVSLFDMDSLSARVAQGLADRQAEIPQVQKILVEERDAFLDYLASLDVIPLIVQMRRQANDIRQAEIDKALRRIPDLPPEAQPHIEALTRAIVNKILHSPTVCLRAAANSPQAVDYAELTRSLFGLD